MQGPRGILLIGVGNELRGDDGVGLRVARRVRAAAPGFVRVVESAREPMALLDLWARASEVTVVDATCAGREAGRVVTLEVGADAVGELPWSDVTLSSHGFGVGDAVALARALGRLPDRLVLYGIEAGQFAPGTGMSDEVVRAADRLAARLVAEFWAREDGEGR